MDELTVDVEQLPKTIVRRVVKEKLSDLSDDGPVMVHKDAVLAFSEAARVFIHYLSATANDICKESRRQIVNAEDVLKALEEIEFPEFVDPLKASLDVYREIHTGKREATTPKENESKKKSKISASETASRSKKATNASNTKNNKSAKKKVLNGTKSNSKNKKAVNGTPSTSTKKAKKK
uniref:Transcription factor CBF/NF-Y/archaeal histone domain-containing protein n=1 Tax=Kalanchoe fedtschenkoi TaxID=63787 RepID=A0A7N0U6V3_KALFE